MDHKTILKVSTVFLVGISAISLLPLVVLFIEFSQADDLCGQSYWFYVAKFYGSYFLFPIFGLLCSGFLVGPLAVFWLILRQPECRVIFRYAIGAWISLVVTASALEFTGSPHALFEISPLAQSSSEAKDFYQNFSSVCDLQGFSFKGKYTLFQDKLGKALLKERSISGYIYFFCIPAQAGLLFLLLCGFGLILFFKKTYITDFLIQQKMPWLRDNTLALFGFALTIRSLWCLYRISYRIDNLALFQGSNNPLYADFAIMGLYLSVIVFYIAFVGFDLDKIGKTMSQIVGAAAIVGFSLSAPSGIAGHFFGTDAVVQNLLAVVLGILVLVALGLLLNNPPPPLQPPAEEDG